MRLGDLDALSAFVGDLRSTLHKEQSTFKAMTQSEFEIKDNMLLNFQYVIDNAPTVLLPDFKEGYKQAIIDGKTNFSRPQGEWIDNNIPYLANCSNCGYQMDTHEEHGYFNYCPYCGANMKKGGDSNENDN